MTTRRAPTRRSDDNADPGTLAELMQRSDAVGLAAKLDVTDSLWLALVQAGLPPVDGVGYGGCE